MVEQSGLRPMVRPFMMPNRVESPSQVEDDQVFDVNDSDSDDLDQVDFEGVVPQEESKEVDLGGVTSEERRRMDQNVLEYEKKLSDFERMFLFINDDLDFEKLSHMAQEIERYKVTAARGSEKMHKLTVRDTYGFIQQDVPSQASLLEAAVVANGGDEEEDWDARINDRRESNDSQTRAVYKKQGKMVVVANSKPDRDSSESNVTQFGQFVKGSLEVRTASQQPQSQQKQQQQSSSEEQADDPGQLMQTLGTLQVQRLPSESISDPEMERRRCAKWFDMLDSLKRTGKSYRKLKSRARKGIPDSIRGVAWPILAGADQIVPECYGEGGKQEWMKDLLRRKLDRAQLICIFNDIPRTLPHHVYFAESQGTGQKALFAVLKCVSLQFSECGYVQGMNSLCGTLMTYTTPEDTFAITASILQNYQTQDCYFPGLPGLEKNFYIMLALLRKYMPRLQRKLAEIDFSPQMHASSWFLTLFADYFPIGIVVRIFDIYLFEGRKILFRIALAIFKLSEQKLMQAEDIELPLTHLKKFPETCDVELLIKTAHKFTFSRSLLDKLEQDYKDRPNEEIFQICKLL